MLAEQKRRNGVDNDPRRLLVDRVVGSATFARAPRLADFLRFVSDRMLTGQISSINEQEIGVQVFGRDAGYLQSDDNIVRVNASRLRQRLEEYFSSEGAAETLRIALPKGRYIPEFTEAPVVVPDVASPETALLTPSQTEPVTDTAGISSLQRRQPIRLLWFAAVCVLCLAASLLTLSHKRAARFSRAASVSPASDPFWTQFLVSDAPTLVIPADSSLIIYDRLSHTTVDLPEYMSGAYRTVQDSDNEQVVEAKSLAQRRTTSLADLSLVSTVQRMSDAANSQMKVIFARDLRTQDLQNSNAILLGASASNPWVSVYDANRHFSIQADENTRTYTIRNETPSGHDFSVIRYKAKDPQYLAYAIVAFLPNQDKKHNVLILEGTLESGTQAAIDFVFDAKQMSSLLAGHRRADGSLPYFEFLLECDVLSGRSPGARIVAQRFF